MLDENVGRTTREHVAVIKRNGEHLLGLIGDILDLSKIEAGKLQVEPARFSPVQVVTEVVSLMSAQADAKRLTLKMELAGPVPDIVLTDPLLLRQILVNLVGNAIKFTSEGEICVTARMIFDSGPPRLCFDVADMGIGMTEEQMDKLFQPFSQADCSSTRNYGGTGLGLCISKRLAEALGGNIEVRSELGKGSTFIVTIDPGPAEEIQMIDDTRKLAVEPNPPTPTSQPTNACKVALHGRILLVEDSLDNQRLISYVLGKAGGNVTAVENGQLAVDFALAAQNTDEPFDVILMDIQMPVLDGYEATRELRKRGYSGPIIALTASAMHQDRQRCIDAGCNDYLTKPIDRWSLLTLVAEYMDAGNANGSPSADYAVTAHQPSEDLSS
jgi:CheY-like chemotaxis protein